MTQGVLSFQLCRRKKRKWYDNISRIADISWFGKGHGVIRIYSSAWGVRKDSQGRTDEQIITSIILLNLSGGDSVDDLKILQSDEGFCRIINRVETNGLTRRERRELERRWRERHLINLV